jgi:hypothetical protein
MKPAPQYPILPTHLTHLTRLTHLTHQNQALITGVNKIKSQEDRTMKKTYRLTIDYMMEINEKVKVDGECSRELLEKTQHIMNAFFLVPDVLDEFIKERLYYCYFNTESANKDLAELIRLKKEAEYMPDLCRQLPAGTVPYFQDLFCHVENNSTDDEDLDEGLDLLVVQFSRPIPLSASFKEIEDIDCLSLDKGMNCPGLENCKLVQGIIEFLHQGARCA